MIAGLVAGFFPATGPAQTNTRFLSFNNAPLFPYYVITNGSTRFTVLSSPSGVVEFSTLVSTGDVLILSPDSTTNTQPPPPPFVLDAVQEGAGCFRVTWVPPGDPSVTGYVVSYGTSSTAEGGTYDHSFDAGFTEMADVCGLSQGTWYVAVQAKNYAGQLSAFSAEFTVEISPTPVLFLGFAARPRDRAVMLTWKVFSDEYLRGFRVDRTGPLNGPDPGGTRRIADESALDGQARSVMDHDVEPGLDYRYTITAVAGDGTEIASAVAVGGIPAPDAVQFKNSPNPFNPVTTITVVLPAAGPVRMAVYDVKGREITVLLDGPMTAGRHDVRWDGRDRHGNPVTSGFYYCRLRAGKTSRNLKMLLLK